ncbi:MAG: polysaccharide biosynthesis tyrosine autokinase, partial [Lewinella sp.]|nr:polysaccharide biosynthesis tyrosine autokinase [Lewinella sp.]
MTIENYKGLRFDGRLFDLGNRDIDYRGLLNKYFLSKWYYYALSFMVCVGLTYLYVRTIEPTYAITSKLLITEGERDTGSPEDWLKRSLNFSASPDNVYNEIQVLTSFALVKQVVDFLNLDINYYWQEKYSRRTGYTNFPISVSSYKLSSPWYYGTSFQVIPMNGEQFQMKVGEDVLGTYNFDEEFSNNFGDFCFQLQGNPYLHPESGMFVEFLNPPAITESYLYRLYVGFIDIKSTTLEIYLEDAVPARGIDFLENLIIRYHQIKNQENNRVANNTLQFIDERLVDIGRDLRSIEYSVESYKLNNSIASESTSDLQILLESANRLDREKENYEVQLNILESMKQKLNMSGDNFELITVGNGASTDIKIQEIVKQYNDKVLARRELLVTSQASHPVVQSATQQLISLRNTIYAAIDNMQNDLRLQVGNVNNQYNRSVSQLRSVPTKERQLTDKAREKAIVEDLYVYLLQKREETALSLIGTAVNSIVIDPPRSTTQAVSPNKMKYYFGGSFFGLALPFLLISMVEIFKNSIESEDQLKALLPAHPVVGLINKRRSKGKQIVVQKGRSLISDRFRSLRTNLQFMANDGDKCIMVTSSASMEGKTFIATNVAASFAVKDEKTVIIDFDLRNPQVANYLDTANGDTGLSTFFSGETPKVEDIIQSSNIKNLDYIAFGPAIDYHDELVLNEQKLAKLFGYLKANYDTIVVDTSPVGIITDAILLNKYITQTLYVVRVGFTKKEMIEK